MSTILDYKKNELWIHFYIFVLNSQFYKQYITSITLAFFGFI